MEGVAVHPDVDAKKVASQHETRSLVLLGLGHTHLHVLKKWQLRPLSNVRLVCVSNQHDATYSGMLPGVLAGDYRSDQMKIDLVRRCDEVGVELVLAETVGIDRQKKQLIIRDRLPLNYDLLSIGIGSRPAKIEGDNHAISIKPMQTFLQRLKERLAPLQNTDFAKKIKVMIVGGGAGGVEIACCLPRWVRREFGNTELEITIVHRGERFLESASSTATNIINELFAARNYQCLAGHNVVEIKGGAVIVAGPSDRQQEISADLIISAVSAVGPSLLAKFNLELDDRGFLLTNQFLQTTGDARIFAVGDSGTCQDRPSAKAGVYAVRQGPLLWNNLKAAIEGRSFEEWKPQQDFLWLLNRGDRKAILQYGRFATQGRWCWHLKKFIDTSFVAKHQP